MPDSIHDDVLDAVPTVVLIGLLGSAGGAGQGCFPAKLDLDIAFASHDLSNIQH